MPKKAESSIKTLFPDAFQLAQNIVMLADMYGTTDAEIARAAGVSPATVSRRKKEPQGWTLMEITGIARLWNTSVPRLMVAPRFDEPEGITI